MRTYPHSEYYRDRSSETELCRDFPGDDILIDGLNAMQAHFWNNGVNLDIPIVRVMNTAHYIAAYMFVTTCSGDQMEYDVLAYDSLSRDKRLTRVAMIVLAAMLKRTAGWRANQCRNLILNNRDADFDEGVSLYDRFLRSAETRFAEEDFLIDTHKQIQRLTAENEQLAQENIRLRYTITTMENQQNNQYNNCIIYNAPVYNTSTTNNYYAAQSRETPITDNGKSADDNPKVDNCRENSRVKKLFMTEGMEDMEQTEGEKNRFLNYLTDHHLGKRQLDCSRDNPIIKAIVCFCVKWKRLKYIDKPSPAAVLRFLTETCHISCAADPDALSTFIGRMLKAEYDKDVFDDVEEYF